MYCPKCGNEIKDDAKFCGKCGTLIEIKKTGVIENEKTITGRKSKKVTFVLMGIICVSIVVIVFLKMKGNDSDGKSGNQVVAEEKNEKEVAEKEEEITYRVTGYKNYDENMRLESEEKYTYDEEGLLATREITYYDDNGEKEEIQNVEYTYEKEDATLIMRIKNDFALGRLEFKYDQNRLVEITKYGEDDVIYEQYKYDANGNRISKYMGYDVLAGPFLEESTYDENGKCIKFVRDYIDSENDDFDYCYEYIYNAEGKKIAQIGYDLDNVKWGQGEVVYDGTGKLTEETWVEWNDEESSLSTTKEFKYDENDNLIEVNFNDAFEQLISYDYDKYNNLCFVDAYFENELNERFEYDSHGNLVMHKYYDEDSEYSVPWIPPIRTMIPVVRHSDSFF